MDSSFIPDASALAAVEDDVLRPWRDPAAVVTTGRFARRARNWTLPGRTPLDGELEVTLRLRPAAGHSLELWGGGRLLATGGWSATGRRTLRYRICGERSVSVRVGRGGGPVRFALTLRVP